jgi:copper homeostasis protein (lipoprotein)
MKNISLIIIILSSIIISCSSPKSLDNTYYGFLPCADCIGISYELTLKPDQTYLSKSVYEGKPKNDTFTEEGEYSIENDSILVLVGENDSTHYIIKSSEKLVQLNHEGKTIQSNFQVSMNSLQIQ